ALVHQPTNAVFEPTQLIGIGPAPIKKMSLPAALVNGAAVYEVTPRRQQHFGAGPRRDVEHFKLIFVGPRILALGAIIPAGRLLPRARHDGLLPYQKKTPTKTRIVTCRYDQPILC